jgi:hypothetical protein
VFFLVSIRVSLPFVLVASSLTSDNIDPRTSVRSLTYNPVFSIRQRIAMPGETELHRTLKKEACRWLYGCGYTAVAAEVRLKPLGIIDAVGTGVFRPYHNFHGSRKEQHQTCFVECKASRGDYLRDMTRDGQMTLCMNERSYNLRAKRRRKPLRQTTGLGKFTACLMQPMANLHYVLAPAGLLKKADLPARWGLLTLGPGGISVVVRAEWQDLAAGQFVESAIARTLSGDIFRAGDRAITSVNRELMKQQQQLAEKIRALRPLAPTLFPGGLFGDTQAPAATPASPLGQAAAGVSEAEA